MLCINILKYGIPPLSSPSLPVFLDYSLLLLFVTIIAQFIVNGKYIFLATPGGILWCIAFPSPWSFQGR